MSLTLRRSTALLGISLEPDGLTVCRVRKQGNGAEAEAPFRVPVGAGMFRSDPANASVVLRRHLKAAKVRPQRCVVCIPLTWAFTATVDLPELSGADLQNFLALEAERRFPLPPAELLLCALRPKSAEGARPPALLVGVPAQYIANVETALKAARLKLSGVTLAVAALADENAGTDCALLYAGTGFLDLAVCVGGAPSALRNLEWMEGGEQGSAPIDSRELARQLRITLAQVGPDQQGQLKTAILYGEGDRAGSLDNGLAHTVAAQGMQWKKGVIGALAAPPDGAAAACVAAARAVTGAPASVSLMPQRKPRFQTAAWFSSRNVRYLLAGAGLLVVGIVAALWWQADQLANLEGQWSVLSPRVASVKALQEQVRKYRGWYDESVPSLAIPKCLAEAFPEDGAVWVKSLSIKDGSLATCTGTARSRSDWMRVMDKLGKNRELDDLQVVQTRGDSPFGFTLTFRWKPGKGAKD